jgi:hypothetical protein
MQQKQQCSKIDRCQCSYLRRRGILIPLQEGRCTMAGFCHGHRGYYIWLHPWTPRRKEGSWHCRLLHLWTPALWMKSSMDATEGGEQSDLNFWSKTTTEIMATYFWIVKFLWAHANEKNQCIEMDKTTEWIMAVYVLHIASGLYFQIGASLSLSIHKTKNCWWMALNAS